MKGGFKFWDRQFQTRSEVVLVEMTIGLFAGIFDENGKILLRRRRKESPNVLCPCEGDWELPGGTIEEESILKAKNERIIGQELVREVREETGLLIKVPFMPEMYPAVYVDKERRNINFAFIIPVGVVRQTPTKGDNIYVSPTGLEEIAGQSEGKRLVSGWGKRMCRMALKALCHSPNLKYREEAKRMLLEVQSSLQSAPLSN